MTLPRSIHAFLKAARAGRHAVLSWLVVASFILQAAMSVGHFHPLPADTGATTRNTEHPAPNDRKGDLPCVFCQQASVSGHWLAAHGASITPPGDSSVQPMLPVSGIVPSATSSFDWLSRAPPVR